MLFFWVDVQWLRKWIKKCDDDSETSNWIAANTKVKIQGFIFPFLSVFVWQENVVRVGKTSQKYSSCLHFSRSCNIFLL